MYTVINNDNTADLFYGTYIDCLTFIKEHPELNLDESNLVEE